jgi:hypothetical protein
MHQCSHLNKNRKCLQDSAPRAFMRAVRSGSDVKLDTRGSKPLASMTSCWLVGLFWTTVVTTSAALARMRALEFLRYLITGTKPPTECRSSIPKEQKGNQSTTSCYHNKQFTQAIHSQQFGDCQMFRVNSLIKQFWAPNNILFPNRSAPLGSCNISIVEGEAENSPEEQCFIGKNHYSCLHPFVMTWMFSIWHQ